MRGGDLRPARAMIDCGGTKDPGGHRATYVQSPGRASAGPADPHPLPQRPRRRGAGAAGAGEGGGHRRPRRGPDSDLRQAIAARAAQLDIPMHYITENTDLTLGKAEITLYAPVTGGGDSNEQCLSVLCQANGWEALLTGDMP